MSLWVTGSGSTLRRADHQLDEVETRDLLGHRVFDLQSRIHLEEEEVAGRVVDNVFDGAGRVVPDRGGESNSCLAEAGPGGIRQVGCRRFLEQLLIAPLHRAFACAEVDDVAVLVADDLHLDMARASDVSLDDHPVVSERQPGLVCRRLQRIGEVSRFVGDANAAAPPPPADAFTSTGNPIRSASRARTTGSCDASKPGITGTSASAASLLASILEPIRSIASGMRTDPESTHCPQRLWRTRSVRTGIRSRDGSPRLRCDRRPRGWLPRRDRTGSDRPARREWPPLPRRRGVPERRDRHRWQPSRGRAGARSG